jgi:hypothetical protein
VKAPQEEASGHLDEQGVFVGRERLAEGGPEERLDPLADAVENVRVGVEVRLGISLEEVEDDR